MIAPTDPDRRLLLPGALMATPVILVTALFTGIAAPWLVLAAMAVLPLIGAAMVLRIRNEDVRAFAGYLNKLAMAPGTAIPPAPDDKECIAYDLMAAVARLDRAVTARHDQLAAQLDIHQALLEALPDPLVLVNGERRVHYANRASRNLFGEQMAGSDIALSCRHPDIVAAVEAVLIGRSPSGPPVMVEFSLPGPHECIYQARIKPFRPPSHTIISQARTGEPASAAGMALLYLHDITTIKRAEQLRVDFIANASHELRTPLTTLIGFTETLLGPAKDDVAARERFLGIMHDETGRMTRLVDDLLSLSRIELDEHSPPTKLVDIVRCIRETVAAFELKASARHIRLQDHTPDTLPMVQGDADQLVQVLHNLIGNAIKYTRENTDVTITTSRNRPARTPHPQPPQTISIAVTDQGGGIDRTHLPRLTERFYRVDPARSRALGGTGLGLAIVKHILIRHNGRLTIDSEVGKGSCFTVWLPVAADQGSPRHYPALTSMA